MGRRQKSSDEPRGKSPRPPDSAPAADHVAPGSHAPRRATEPPQPAVSEQDALIDPELLSEFITEAQEHLERAEEAMLRLEEHPADLEAVGRVFRAFHTIKGVASMIELAQIAGLAHAAESLLIPVRDGHRAFDAAIASVALASVDVLRSLVASVASAGSEPRAPTPAYEEVMRSLTREPPAAQHAPPAPAPAPAEVPAPVVATTAPAVVLVSAAPEPSAGALASPQVLPEAAPPVRREPEVAANAGDKPERADKAPPQEDWVRVRTDRLDRLLDLVGELMIAQSMVAADPGVVLGGADDLTRKVTHAGKIVRDLQGLSLSLRMVPIRSTFQKMQRVVRDTAHRTGKSVVLETHGDDVELDRKLVESLGDPLVHMIRNAVDHGIESVADRRARGKPDGGLVTLSARHDSGNVLIELSDDGGGLNKERILRKAIERGLVPKNAELREPEIFDLIFAPGFSTAETVSAVSGRGVGMDVVKRSLESLGGRVEISSVPGQGTRFTIVLPLTLAIVDGMIVRVGRERYVLPTANIVTSLRPAAADLSTLSGRGELLQVRGRVVPLFRLAHLFGVKHAIEDPCRGLVVVVADADRYAALLVDDLVGKQQVVTKSLGARVGKVPGVSAGAILGDGRVGLILDPPSLISLARSLPAPSIDRDNAALA